MKEYEYVGVMLAVAAYVLIVMGYLENGFFLGCLASTMLASYFYMIRLIPSFLLQVFFICANIYGLVNIGVI